MIEKKKKAAKPPLVEKEVEAKKKREPKKKKEAETVDSSAPAIESKVEHKAQKEERKHHVVRVPKAPKKDVPRYFGTGRRKEATAKVWLFPGNGTITINQRPLKEYFIGRRVLELMINKPFAATQTAGKYDVMVEAFGGGYASQADAVRMGIARALIQFNPDLKSALKKLGLMTRDPRMKERKKYGLKRARRAFQFSKR